MNILFICKFPPLQGGVTSSAYRLAHGLAKKGHAVRVITNAREAIATERVFMRPKDRQKIEAKYPRGSVSVDWTDPRDFAQRHIPNDNPVVSKLVSLGLDASREKLPDVIFSFYLEPYCVAGHILAQLLNVAHVVRTAGSDAGRLWRHSQLAPFYDEIFKSAAAVWTGPMVAVKLKRLGIAGHKIIGNTSGKIPEDLFRPSGPALNLHRLVKEARSNSEIGVVGRIRNSKTPVIGMYGKLTPSKGVFELLNALAWLNKRKIFVQLAVCGQARPEDSRLFWRRAKALGVDGQIVQLPFIPYWRIPEFIRMCRAVCCLEQDFPIKIHSPMIAREVLACGGVLIGSTEILRKTPLSERLVHGYNCIAIADVRNVAELGEGIKNAINPGASFNWFKTEAAKVAREMQRDIDDVSMLESILGYARRENARRENPPIVSRENDFCQTLMKGIKPLHRRKSIRLINEKPGTIGWAKRLVKALTSIVEQGESQYQLAVEALDLWLLCCQIQNASRRRPEDNSIDPLFRFPEEAAFATKTAFKKLAPIPIAKTVCHDYSFSADHMLVEISRDRFPVNPPKAKSYVLAQHGVRSLKARIMVLDELSYDIYRQCDGSASVAEIMKIGNGAEKKEIFGIVRELFLSAILSFKTP